MMFSEYAKLHVFCCNAARQNAQIHVAKSNFLRNPEKRLWWRFVLSVKRIVNIWNCRKLLTEPLNPFEVTYGD